MMGKWSISKCIKVVDSLDDLAEFNNARECVKELLRVVSEMCSDYYVDYPGFRDMVSRLRIALKS